MIRVVEDSRPGLEYLIIMGYSVYSEVHHVRMVLPSSMRGILDKSK